MAVLYFIYNCLCLPETKKIHKKPTKCQQLGCHIFPENVKTDRRIFFLAIHLYMKLLRRTFSHHFTDSGLIFHPFQHLMFSGLHGCVNFTVHRGEHGQSIQGSGHCCNAATNRHSSGVMTLEQRCGSMS